MLTQDKIRELLEYDPDTGEFTWKMRKGDRLEIHSFNARCGGKKAFINEDGDGYWHTTIFNKRVKAHRIAWLYMYGYLPTAVDHINGNRKDNRICNLREAHQSENMRNVGLSRLNKSGLPGVRVHSSGKWCAEIKVNRKSIHLGLFGDFFEAVAARKSAEVKYGFHKNHGSIRETYKARL